MNRIAKRLALVVAGVATALGAAAPVARAQIGMGPFGGGDMSSFSVPIGRRSIETYSKILGLDKDQKDAARVLADGHRDAMKQLGEDVQRAMMAIQEKFQDTRDVSVWQKEMPEQMKKFAERAESLEKGFFQDLKTILTPEQEGRFVRVERARRRETVLRVNFVSGQGVDLLSVLDRVGVDPGAKPDLADAAERYEIEVDRHLVAFEKWGREQQEKAMTDMMNFDMNKINAMLKELADRSRAIRDANRQHARSIQALLPADKQAAFELEINRRAFPRVYRESYVHKAIETSLGMNDLDGDQRAALLDLKARYESQAAGANQAWAKAIEDQEEKNNGAIGVMMSGMMMMEQGGAGNTVADAKKARRDLDDQFKDRIKGILREDQAKRLPEDKPQPENPWDMFGGLMSPNEEDGP